METIAYKGFQVEAIPYRLAGSGDWRMRIYITRTKAESLSARRFFAVDAFTTRREATEHCLNFGREIIDGKYSDCSLEDL